MKVLLIAPVPPPYGGMALQARQLHKLLSRDGLHVELFASNFPFPAALRMVEKVPLARTVVRAILIWFRLGRRVSGADVIHVLAASWWYFFLVVYPAVLLGRICGKRVVLNYRGGEAREFFGRYGWLAQPVFSLASVVAVPSAFLAEIIEPRFRVPVSIVPNILDFSLFAPRQRSTIRPRMLVTRHLEKIYDVESVLKAFRAVQARHPDASLWIAGTGAEEARLRDLVSEWQLHHVRFLGEIPHHELPAICDECDIYVNASLVDNFPGALLEASAAGLVVVTTGAGGIPYIYENGRTAWVVSPGDWQALARAIEAVLGSPSVTFEMIKAAAAEVRKCEWPEVRKRLFEAYGFKMDALVTGGAGMDGARCVAG